MVYRESREEEYLRKMKALGYEPSLAGMDDEDIEWELARMDGGKREARTLAPTLNPTYRPVDPGLAARIFRQMGRPYDPRAIGAKESFYINGWDDGEDEEDTAGEPAKLLPGFRPRQDGAKEEGWGIDPWAKAWKIDWGDGASPARTMEYRPARDGTPRMRTMEFRVGRDEGAVV
ncbi:MAG TPA: hypothetical protein VN436_10735, partial [Holophaga sp.]|nr:hypothetical protein [Holophaga sp.]